jgi:acyl carrier protein
MTTALPSDSARRAELLDKLLRKRRLEQQSDDRIVAEPWTGAAALSSQQSGLWLADELANTSATYNMVTMMRLRGPFEIGLLNTALSGLVSRHEGLRTSFAELEGVPQMRVEPVPGRFWLEHLDLSAVPEDLRAQRALELVTACVQEHLDLRHAPLMRCFLARVDAEDHILGYVLHHIVSDGWSLPILARELSELYRAAAEGRPANLPVQTIQPSDVYRWQRTRLSNPVVRQRLDRWRDELAGMPPLRFPLDRPRPTAASSAGRKALVDLPAELIASADELARATGRTPFSVLLAAFAVLLQQRSGQYDLAIGSVFSGRTRTELESLIGYFANTGVLRIRTAEDQPVDELVQHCHDVLLDAQQVQDIPFPDVVNAVAPVRVPGTNPLFQICFTVARGGVTVSPLDLEGVETELISIEARGSRFDILLQVTERADGSFVMMMEYATELFDDSTIRRLAADYRSVLREMLGEPGPLTVGLLQRASDLHTPPPTPLVAIGEQTLRSVPADPGRAEAGDLRDALARIWVEVFGAANGFRDDQNFFEIGGTSLSAVRLRARILSEFGIDIPLTDIFAGGSIVELLPYIETGLTTEPADPAEPSGQLDPSDSASLLAGTIR